jgi:hypothetical protein
MSPQQPKITLPQSDPRMLFQWAIISIVKLNKDIGFLKEALKDDNDGLKRVLILEVFLDDLASNVSVGEIATGTIFDLSKMTDQLKYYIGSRNVAQLKEIDSYIY